jgi:hypothetical protein
VRVVLFFLLILAFRGNSYSQEYDSVSVADSLYDYFEDSFTDGEDAQGLPDSSVVAVRGFDGDVLSSLKSDPDLTYKEPPTIAETLWDRLLAILRELLDSMVEGAVTTDWGRLISYTIGIILLVALIMMVLKVDAFKVFFKGETESRLPYNILDENIHEMDFDKLIAEATANREYRKGVRLLFLKSLKILSDKDLIHWEQGKTNHDYMAELTKEDLKPGFNELNHYFEYTWYGNFSINSDTFQKIQNVFTTWSGRIR